MLSLFLAAATYTANKRQATTKMKKIANFSMFFVSLTAFSYFFCSLSALVSFSYHRRRNTLEYKANWKFSSEEKKNLTHTAYQNCYFADRKVETFSYTEKTFVLIGLQGPVKKPQKHRAWENINNIESELPSNNSERNTKLCLVVTNRLKCCCYMLER